MRNTAIKTNHPICELIHSQGRVALFPARNGYLLYSTVGVRPDLISDRYEAIVAFDWEVSQQLARLAA